MSFLRRRIFRKKSVFSLLYLEGAFAMMYDSWLGPAYLISLAGLLKVPIFWVSILSAVPWVGSIGQFFVQYFTQNKWSNKKATLIFAIPGRLIWTIPILLSIFAWKFPHVLSAEEWFASAVLIAFLSAALTSTAGVYWFAWMRSLIVESHSGSFFGFRQQIVMSATILAGIVGAAIVAIQKPLPYLGFFIIGVLAILCGGISSYFLSQVSEAKKKVVSKSLQTSFKTSDTSRKEFFLPLRNKNFIRIIICGGLMMGSLQIAGPYFPYYFVKELGILPSEVAFWGAFTSLGCVIAARLWGRSIDRTKNPEKFFSITACLLALSPLPYLIKDVTIIRWIAPVEYFFNGVAWSGYMLAATGLLFKVNENNKGREQTAYARIFSLYTLSVGICGALGALGGGMLISLISSYWGGDSYRKLWVIASMLRMSVGVAAIFLLGGFQNRNKTFR